MKKFVNVVFIGRKVGAIGKLHRIKARVEVPRFFTREDILKALYESYEHINQDSVTVKTRMKKPRYPVRTPKILPY